MKERLDLIDALKAYKHATAVLVEKWERFQGESGLVGTEGYPFHASFDELAHEVSDWTDAFIGELHAVRYWIDLRENDGECFWIFKQNGDTVVNDIGVTEREGTDGLTEITEGQYKAIYELWMEFGKRYMNQHWNERSIADDILDIINTPA